MKELQNELHRHYALLLGVKSPWEVNGVGLDMEGKRVEITLDWGEGMRFPVGNVASRAGLWLLIKRLERGTFSWPKLVDPQMVKLRLAPEALAMLTDGIDSRGGRLRPWYDCE